MTIDETKMLYVHPAPVRVWHWVNAAGFILLILTGLQLRYPEIFPFMSLQDAVTIHNYVGFVVIGNYFLWVAYYFGTLKIRIYIPNLITFIPAAIRQALFYGYGIFKGDPNPHHMTPDHKFNAMQQSAYLFLMVLLLPVQMITGLFLWDVQYFQDYIQVFGGIKIIDSVHVLIFFFFAAFMCIHCYLATLGHTPFAHFKAMFTGYEEHH